MTDFLIARFVRDADNVNNPQVRERYGVLSGGTGILVNVLLCLMKLMAGYISGSVAIIGDGINNLSDAGSSVVTMLGMRFSARPADEEHPFGHGRIEYLTAMAVAMVIVAVGIELIRSSYEKIVSPEPVEVSVLAVGVMVLSVAFKLWLGAFNKHLGKKTNSPAFNAVAADSMSDCVATSVVILCLALYAFTGYNLDGVAGIAVGLFIIYSGWGALNETLHLIVGEPADGELNETLREIAHRDKRVLGIHDVLAHCYGPGRIYASLHVEVDSQMTLMEAHAIASRLENVIQRELEISAIVHIDPKIIGDNRFDAISDVLNRVIRSIDGSLCMHDLHIYHGHKLVFDVEVPYSFILKDEELKELIAAKVIDLLPGYRTSVTIDRV